MTSKSLQAKIAAMQTRAPFELPKVRLCADVILQHLMSGKEQPQTIAALKAIIGPNWSETTAVQFMSGRQAVLAIECARPEERRTLYAAHLIAKELCCMADLTSAARKTLEMPAIQAMVDRANI